MNIFFILLIMLFVHVIDDFHLQGILANMKQINWWKKEVYKEYKGQRDKFNMYHNDWIPCIIWHAFQWSCMIIIPCIVNNFNITNKLYFYIVIFINMIIHAIIDHLKCNKYLINLITDQLCHICQIFITWLIICVIIK